MRPGNTRGSDRRVEAIFLVAGDKAGNWEGWYRKAIPLADERFTQHLADLEEEEEEEEEEETMKR